MRARAFDTRKFRNALGCFATGVCVVTTRSAEGRREGLTVNSFASVSLKPPLILWSLSRHAQCAPAFRDAKYFAVNVLAADQRDLSLRFARAGGDKYAGIEDLLCEGLGRVPLLRGAIARFECRNQFQNYGGDHVVLIGLVERFAHWSGAPLLYYRGRYRALG
ncbi:MAG: flavin reductase family protein [Betaproteobacteria bacterium]|nr:flavin reductase family protein [Betaproteobacteria bacterium]